MFPQGAIDRVPYGAALSALDPQGTYDEGAIAYVASRRCFYSLHRQDATGFTAAGGGSWVYHSAAHPNVAALQATWYIDPVGGSDDNAGASVAAPIQTFAEYIRRVGKTGPTLDGNIHPVYAIIFLNSQSAGADPIVWEPLLANGAVAMIQGQPKQVGAGTLASLSAMTIGSLGTGHPLRAVLPGSPAAGCLVVNTTRSNARCMAQSSAGGSSWNLTRPYAPFNVGTDGISFTPVDTFANGDSVTVYSLPGINLARFAPTIISFNGAFSTSGYLYQVNVQSTLAILEIRPLMVMVDCYSTAFLNSDSSVFINTVIANESVSRLGLAWGGGVAAGANHTMYGQDVADSSINFGCIVEGTVVCRDMQIGSVCVATGGQVTVRGTSCIASGTETMQLYGGGIVDVHGSASLIIDTGSTSGADTFKQASLKINGGTSAVAVDLGSDPAVWHPSRALNTGSGAGQNLDVSVAGGGFAGRAINPGGASIVKGIT